MHENRLFRLFPLLLLSVGSFGLASCKIYKGAEENCVFINEKANLHNEYYVTVLGVEEHENIYIYKNSEDTEKSQLIGTSVHYIEAKVLIERQLLTGPKEDHTFDTDDFKIKDHTGVQIKNLNLFSNENGLALETTDFSTQKVIKDYSWFGQSVESGSFVEVSLFFSFSKSLSVFEDMMVLEFDFFSGRSNGKSGTDIVLAYRNIES